MPDSIRENIISAVEAKLADILTTKAYNTSIGGHVYRVKMKIDPDNLPCVNMFPMPENVEHVHGEAKKIMTILIGGIADYGDSNPSVIAEQMLADLIECMAGYQFTMPFDSGGVYEIVAGDTIEGATSGATALVDTVSKSSGTWAGGDAAGNLTLRQKIGKFQDGENLDVGVNSDVATINGSVTKTSPEDGTCGGYADNIRYIAGGTETYPEPGHLTVGVVAEFEIAYFTLTGDPYHQ